MINYNKKQVNKNFSLKTILAIDAIILLVVLLLDYFNFFASISKNLNFEFLNIFVNSLVIVTMFFVTYNFIEKRNFDINLEQKDNKANVLYTLLLRTYNNCISTLDFINNQEYFEKYFIPKCDFNAINDPFLQRQLSLPFEFDSEIINLMKDGVADKEILINYLEIKALFRTYFNKRVVFFDIGKYDDKKSKELNALINKDKIKLENRISEEVKNIDL